MVDDRHVTELFGIERSGRVDDYVVLRMRVDTRRQRFKDDILV